MGNDKKDYAEAMNACNFLVGKWTYCECSSLVERYWTKPGSNQCTASKTFKTTTGSVEYREILYGSHIHGEYWQEARPDKAVMNVLFQRATGDLLEMTVAASDANRFCGPARLSGGSVLFEGKGIPFFMGDYLQEARIPLVPQAESKPVTSDAVCNARLALHPLRPDLWLIVVYHVFNSSSDHPTLLKTEVLHFRSESKDTPVSRDDLSERMQQTQKMPSSPLEFTDLEDRLADVERELEEKRREFEELKGELEGVKDEHEDALDEIVDLDLASFGWIGPDRLVESGSVPLPFDGAKWQEQYASLFDLMEQLHELEDDFTSAQDDIEDLEDEADDIEEALDQGYAAWEEREYRKAKAVIEKAPARPASPATRLLSEEALACLSDDARRLLETYLQLDGVYAEQPDLQNLDWSPLVSSMSKLCERILADFLGPRCLAIYADQQAFSLLNDPKRMMSIPADDQTFKTHKGALRKVLGLIEKPGPVKWSGTRNQAIALLLFGRTYKMGDGIGEEITNPLNLYGTEEERQELRLDLYRLQQLRNGFIHHDLAGWTEALEVKQCFEECVQRLVRVLFGVEPT